MDDGSFRSDYVRIFDGDSYGKLHLMAQLTGSNLPSNMSTVRSQMLIVFDSHYRHESDKSNERGFKANIIFEEANTYIETTCLIFFSNNKRVILWRAWRAWP